MVSSLRMIMLYVPLATILVTSAAFADNEVNSICTVRATSEGKAPAAENNRNAEFSLASISKILTSLWALESLGPSYRFTTRLHITPLGSDTYDVHIEGGRDPVVGKNVKDFLISELNRNHVYLKKIKTLTFDENFFFDWPTEKGSPFNVRSIGHKSSSYYSRRKNTTTLTYRSAPLHAILKYMNNQSNHHISDQLYWSLGGNEEFNKFLREAPEFDYGSLEDLNMNLYGHASCKSIIKALYRMDILLDKEGFNLSDIITVAGHRDNYEDSTEAKTVSTMKDKTLAGRWAAKKAVLYLSVLMQTEARMEFSGVSSSR